AAGYDPLGSARPRLSRDEGPRRHQQTHQTSRYDDGFAPGENHRVLELRADAAVPARRGVAHSCRALLACLTPAERRGGVDGTALICPFASGGSAASLRVNSSLDRCPQRQGLIQTQDCLVVAGIDENDPQTWSRPFATRTFSNIDHYNVSDPATGP